MKKGKFVKKLVPATTTNKQKTIINFLLSEGHSASRINTMGIWSKELGMYIRGGGRVGHSDISGVLKSRFRDDEGKHLGIAIYIEGKFTATDSLSDEQTEFLQEVTHAGAITMICENLEDFYKWYEIIKKKYL